MIKNLVKLPKYFAQSRQGHRVQLRGIKTLTKAPTIISAGRSRFVRTHQKFGKVSQGLISNKQKGRGGGQIPGHHQAAKLYTLSFVSSFRSFSLRNDYMLGQHFHNSPFPNFNGPMHRLLLPKELELRKDSSKTTQKKRQT